jgi:hypothetical protein
MTRIRTALLVSLVAFATCMVAPAMASAEAKLGPEEIILTMFGEIKPGLLEEIAIKNDTKEIVKISNIVVKNDVAPMKLELDTTKNEPECLVNLELAKEAKCWIAVLNGGKEEGGEGTYVIQAENNAKTKKYQTSITAL